MSMKKTDPADDKYWTAESLLKMAAKYIERYERLIKKGEAGHPNVRLSECRELLEVWQGVKASEGDIARLTMREFREIEEAIEDEKFS